MKVTNYTPEYGDIDYAYGTSHQKFLIDYDEKLVKNLNPLHLAYFNDDRWHAWVDHPLIGLEGHEFRDQCHYSCLFLKDAYAFVPKYIFSDNIEKYFDHYEYDPWFKDIALDVEWTMTRVGQTKEQFWENLNEYCIERDHFFDLLLGTGHHEGILPSDGSAGLKPFLVELNNGDYIYGYGWVWYNK